MRRTAVAGVLSAALLLFGAAGCSARVQPDAPAGSLDLVEVSKDQRERPISIGDVEVEEPGSGLWDKPGGLTIGRVLPGTYPVYGAQDGWFQVRVVTEGVGSALGKDDSWSQLDEQSSQSGDTSDPSGRYAWVPGSSVAFYPKDTQ